MHMILLQKIKTFLIGVLLLNTKIAYSSSCFGPQLPYPALFSFGEDVSSVDSAIFSSNQDFVYLMLRSKEPSWFFGENDTSTFKISVMKYPAASPRDLKSPLWNIKIPSSSHDALSNQIHLTPDNSKVLVFTKQSNNVRLFLLNSLDGSKIQIQTLQSGANNLYLPKKWSVIMVDNTSFYAIFVSQNANQNLAFLTYFTFNNSGTQYQIQASHRYLLSQSEFVANSPNIYPHMTNSNIISVYIPHRFSAGNDFIPQTLIYELNSAKTQFVQTGRYGRTNDSANRMCVVLPYTQTSVGETFFGLCEDRDTHQLQYVYPDTGSSVITVKVYDVDLVIHDIKFKRLSTESDPRIQQYMVATCATKCGSSNQLIYARAFHTNQKFNMYYINTFSAANTIINQVLLFQQTTSLSGATLFKGYILGEATSLSTLKVCSLDTSLVGLSSPPASPSATQFDLIGTQSTKFGFIDSLDNDPLKSCTSFSSTRYHIDKVFGSSQSMTENGSSLDDYDSVTTPTLQASIDNSLDSQLTAVTIDQSKTLVQMPVCGSSQIVLDSVTDSIDLPIDTQTPIDFSRWTVPSNPTCTNLFTQTNMPGALLQWNSASFQTSLSNGAYDLSQSRVEMMASDANFNINDTELVQVYAYMQNGKCATRDIQVTIRADCTSSISIANLQWNSSNPSPIEYKYASPVAEYAFSFSVTPTHCTQLAQVRLKQIDTNNNNQVISYSQTTASIFEITNQQQAGSGIKNYKLQIVQNAQQQSDRSASLRLEAFDSQAANTVLQQLDFTLIEQVNCALGQIDSILWLQMEGDQANPVMEIVLDGQPNEAILRVSKGSLYSSCTLNFAIVSTDLPQMAQSTLLLDNQNDQDIKFGVSWLQSSVNDPALNQDYQVTIEIGTEMLSTPNLQKMQTQIAIKVINLCSREIFTYPASFQFKSLKTMVNAQEALVMNEPLSSLIQRQNYPNFDCGTLNFHLRSKKDIQKPIPSFIKQFNPMDGSFRVESKSDSDVGLHQFEMITYLAELNDIESQQNPKLDLQITIESMSEQAKKQKEKFTIPLNTAPFFKTQFENIVLESYGKVFIDLSQPKDSENDKIDLQVELGDANKFLVFDEILGQISRKEPIDEALEGNYVIKITLSDDNNENPMTQTYSFQVKVEPSFQFEVLQSDQSKDQEGLERQFKIPVPKVHKFSSEGVLEIKWNKKMSFGVKNEDFTSTEKEFRKVISVRNAKTGIVEQRESLELRVYDFENVDLTNFVQTSDNYEQKPSEIQSRKLKEANIRVENARNLQSSFYSDERLKFAWKLSKIDPDGTFQIQLDFEQIYQISQSQIEPDFVELIFWNSDLFVTAEGFGVEQQKTILVKIPQQVPANQAKAVKMLGQSTQAAVSTIGGGSFVINIAVSASLNYVWGMLHSLQFMIHLPLISVTFPPLTINFFQNLIQIARFDIIDTKPLIEPLLTIDESRGPFGDNFEQLLYPSRHFLLNAGSLLLFIFLTLLLLAIYGLIAQIKAQSSMSFGGRLFQKIQQKLRALLIWKLVIRFIMEGSLEFFIMCLMDIREQSFGTTGNIISFDISLILVFIQLAYGLLYVRYFLRKRFDRLSLTENVEKFEETFEHLDLRQGRNVLLEPEYYIYRRFIFAYMTLQFVGKSYLQLSTLYLLILGQVSLTLGFRVYRQAQIMKIETFNDLCLLAICYHTVLFTDYNDRAILRDWISKSCIVFVSVNIGVNLYIALAASVRKLILTYKRKKYAKKAQNQRVLQTINIKESPNPRLFKRSKTTNSSLVDVKMKHRNDVAIRKDLSQIREESLEKVSLSLIDESVHTARNDQNGQDDFFLLPPSQIKLKESSIELLSPGLQGGSKQVNKSPNQDGDKSSLFYPHDNFHTPKKREKFNSWQNKKEDSEIGYPNTDQRSKLIINSGNYNVFTNPVNFLSTNVDNLSSNARKNDSNDNSFKNQQERVNKNPFVKVSPQKLAPNGFKNALNYLKQMPVQNEPLCWEEEKEKIPTSEYLKKNITLQSHDKSKKMISQEKSSKNEPKSISAPRLTDDLQDVNHLPSLIDKREKKINSHKNLNEKVVQKMSVPSVSYEHSQPNNVQISDKNLLLLNRQTTFKPQTSQIQLSNNLFESQKTANKMTYYLNQVEEKEQKQKKQKSTGQLQWIIQEEKIEDRTNEQMTTRQLNLQEREEVSHNHAKIKVEPIRKSKMKYSKSTIVKQSEKSRQVVDNYFWDKDNE